MAVKELMRLKTIVNYTADGSPVTILIIFFSDGAVRWEGLDKESNPDAGQI